MEITRKTIINDEPYLRQRSEEVDFNDKSYLTDIEALKAFCQKDGMFALSPVQIGIPKRMMYIRSTTTDLSKIYEKGYDESRVFINPVIINRKGLTKYLEACASCPDPSVSNEEFNNADKYLSCVVKRPYTVEIEYYDINGNKRREILTGLAATVFCHEYDHLNGILHIDYGEEIWSMTGEEKTEYKRLHPYEVISEDCEYDYDKGIKKLLEPKE